MRPPNLQTDGWSLNDGEEYHREAPVTFWIPALAARQNLHPGDFAKLIFNIAIDDPKHSIEVERMWVIVRERTSFGYFGVLDNDPTSIAKNDEFWSGVEVPFEPRHIIDVDHATEASVAAAAKEPARRWK